MPGGSLVLPRAGDSDLALVAVRHPSAWLVCFVGSLHTMTGVCTLWAKSALASTWSSSLDCPKGDLDLGVRMVASMPACWAMDCPPVLAKSSEVDPVTEEQRLDKLKDGSD